MYYSHRHDSLLKSLLRKLSSCMFLATPLKGILQCMTIQIKSKPGSADPLKKILSSEKRSSQLIARVLHVSQQEEF